MERNYFWVPVLHILAKFHRDDSGFGAQIVEHGLFLVKRWLHRSLHCASGPLDNRFFDATSNPAHRHIELLLYTDEIRVK